MRSFNVNSKDCTIVYCTVFFFLILSSFLFVSVTSGNESVDISSSRFDFGAVQTGSIVNHVFEIHNRTSVEIKINKVRTSCSCLKAKISDSVIEPHGVSEISAEVKVGKLYGDAHYYIFLDTGNETNPMIRLELKGKISVPFILDTQDIEFITNYDSTEILPVNLEFYSSEVQVKDVECSGGWFKVSGMEKKGKKVRISFKLTKKMVPGNRDAKFTIYVSNCPDKYYQIPISWKINGPVTITPEKIVVVNEELMTRFLYLKSKNKKIVIRKILDGDKELKPCIEYINDQTVISLENVIPGKDSVELKLITDLDEFPVIPVPVVRIKW